MSLGMRRGSVYLEEYSIEWKEIAKKTINDLWDILGDIVFKIEHIGSTSIEYLKAKPIIDIVVVVKKLEYIRQFDEKLNQKGIIFRGADVDNQLLYVMGDFENDTRTHHIHVVEEGDIAFDNYINFRDYLNDNIDKAIEYQKLKEILSEKYYNNRTEYTKGKQKFIDEILLEAKTWRNKVGDTI